MITDMGSLGDYLRELRVGKGASLDDMARSTRVGRRHLEALEAEWLDELPAPVFVKGFIRAYCQFLETPPDGALARYRQLLAESAAAAAGSTPSGRTRSSWQLGPVLVSVTLLVMLGGALFALNLGVRGTLREPARPPVGRTVIEPAPPAGVEARGDVPVTSFAGAPREERAAEPAPPRQGQRLVVKAIEPTWIRVQTDRGTAVEELLPAGAVREWSTDKRFVLTVGNAGGLELELNGQRLPRLGDRGAVIRDLVLPEAPAAPKS